MADQTTAKQTPPAAKRSDSARIMLFTLAMTTVVALLLGVLFFGLRPIHEKNIAVSNKRAILSAVDQYLPKSVAAMDDAEVLDFFASNVEQYVVKADGRALDGDEAVEYPVAEEISLAAERKKPADQRVYPFFVVDSGTEKFYICSVYGAGLWDAIWGNVALKEDLATIAGVTFDHAGETPGLGAEIKDNPKFSEQFQEKRIFDYNGTYTSVLVRKGGAKDPVYEVDGISGATVTANGVSEMLNRGLALYVPYLKELQSSADATAPATRGAVGMLDN